MSDEAHRSTNINNMVYYKRNLPHYQPEGFIFFITIRLAGTIPKEVYNKIKSDFNNKLKSISNELNNLKKKELYQELFYNRFIKYEQILDSIKFGRKWLDNQLISSVVKDALHYREGKDYKLITYTIMPNHVHIIFKPINFVERTGLSGYDGLLAQTHTRNERRISSFYKVTEIMKSLKWYTAKEANKILNRKGMFWQHESYDHVIRDEKELKKLVEYVLNNPVKIGLTDDPYNYQWSYFNPKYLV